MNCQAINCTWKATSPDANLCWIHYVGVTFYGEPYPRVRVKPKLPIEPLVARLEQLERRGMTVPDIALMAGVSRREVHRLKVRCEPITPARADTWAIRLRCHPSELWPEWASV